MVILTPVVGFASILQPAFAPKNYKAKLQEFREKLQKSHLNENAAQEMVRLTFT